MATLDFPDICPAEEQWTLTYNTQTFTSDLNGITQTSEMPGARWSVSMTFPNRHGVEARRLQGFLAALRGRAGRFWYTPSDWRPFGNPSGTGVVSVQAESGEISIQTDGWDADVAILFESGDYIEINGELKKITASVSSDGAGNATIEFAPALRKQATVGMQIIYTEPRCFLRMDADDQSSWSLTPGITYAVSFNAVEALDL